MSGGYQLPPTEIMEFVDADQTPAVLLSPKRDKIAFLERSSALLESARPELKIGGLRIDPVYNTRSGIPLYTGINICELLNNGHFGPKQPILNLPKDPKINHVKWSPDGTRLAFTVRSVQAAEAATGLELWVASSETRQAYQRVGGGLFLNTLFYTFSWYYEFISCFLVNKGARGVPPKNSLVPLGPKTHSKEFTAQKGNHQGLLADEQNLLDYYGTADFVVVHATITTVNSSVYWSGRPAVYTSILQASYGPHALTTSIRKPYTYNVDTELFPRRTELWIWNGSKYESQVVVTESPHPPSAEIVQEGRRNITWRADTSENDVLCWVESQEDEDTDDGPSRHDVVYTQAVADFESGKTPQSLFRLGGLFRGVVWGDGSIAVVYESCLKTRKVRTWAFTLADGHAKARLLFDQPTEDFSSNPATPILRPGTQKNQQVDVLALTTGADGKKCLLFTGSEATPKGYFSFIDHVDIYTGTKTKLTRVWKSGNKHLETVLGFMSKEQQVKLDQSRVLISRESRTIPRQYYVKTLLDKKNLQLSNFPNPYPDWTELTITSISYGENLTATLYLPPGYDKDEEEPLPTILWTGPEDFKSGTTRGSGNKFFSDMSVTSSPVLWLARRFAVLHSPTLPIIEEEDEKSIGSYMDRLVKSAKAAIDEVVGKKYSDSKKIAVGGHSYGAVTAVNLLALAPGLFCCGIARSGVYDSTPLAFQQKQKKFWEAAMTANATPFVFENITKTPLLLIHGEQEINEGALWAERFYKALEENSAVDTRLVVLPFEDDEYRGRESVLHCLWEMDTWLQKYCSIDPVLPADPDPSSC